MKKTKIILLFLIAFSIVFSFTPIATPQIGTYTFHGAPGNEKTLVVRTANNASLEIVFGAGYVGVIENAFGSGALVVGAKKKSLVTDVNFTHKIDYSFFGLGIHDGTLYNTSNWGWTTGSFSTTPDSTGDTVASFYDPTLLTYVVNNLFAMNVTVQNGAIHFAQLPTSVAQYLGAIVWEPKWQNIGNTVVHNAIAGDWHSFYTFQYLANCTETWTYDSTFGAWIGYKIQANSTTIYEFSIELPTVAEFPLEIIYIIIGIVAVIGIILVIIILKRRK